MTRLLVITTGVAVVRGVGGRRGRALRRAAVRKRAQWIDPSLGEMSREFTEAELVAASVMELMPIPPGYRERRRLAKLRRRARDRDVDGRLRLSPCPFANAANWKDPAWRGKGWWSTVEGRRRWLEQDRVRKLARG